MANNFDVLRARAGMLEVKDLRRERIPGVVDPGASKLVLSKSVVRKLGLPVTDKVKVRYADGRTATRDLVDDVYVELEGRARRFAAVVEPRRTSALIGAIVIEDLDFPVDSRLEKLVPRHPRFIVSEIE